ncbi:MAG: TonB-dependent receptor plug domain-containing protein, partial [Bacteroidales bacterium]|nr:TonB-dependent receptor plug domain-containing protein [Bacteroidales bacterium]
DKLKVSANGFITENIKIGEKHKIVLVNLKFRSDPDSREIAIGYGHVRESDNLMPVSSMEKKDQDFSQFSDIYEVVNVRFPEVQIVNGDIIIRGARSLEGNDAALLVVDGMVVDKSIFGSTHVSHIARIDILKGAAATAYGARGANGVVLVETKTGPNQ